MEVLAVSSSAGFYTDKVENLTITATTYTAGTGGNENGTLVFEFSGSPDLSKVVVGSTLHISSIDEDVENNGSFLIGAVDDGADTITAVSRRGVTGVGLTGKAYVSPFRPTTKIVCTEATTDLVVKDSNGEDLDVGELSIRGELRGIFSEVTVTAGKVIVDLVV